MGPPRGALFADRPGLVLGFPGLQRGLLREVDKLERGGFAAVFMLELFGQRGGARLDLGAPRGPQREQFLWYADDFAYRAFAAFGRLYFSEHPRQSGAEVVFDSGVVELGGGHREPVQRLGV
ncbi:hypothetical protein LAUMK41_05736 [Mycobacterium attenuatum]|nr:hypothetical protein LAUMK41_05736 [Mycobacterium attenuatum]